MSMNIIKTYLINQSQIIHPSTATVSTKTSQASTSSSIATTTFSPADTESNDGLEDQTEEKLPVKNVNTLC